MILGLNLVAELNWSAKKWVFKHQVVPENFIKIEFHVSFLKHTGVQLQYILLQLSFQIKCLNITEIYSNIKIWCRPVLSISATSMFFNQENGKHAECALWNHTKIGFPKSKDLKTVSCQSCRVDLVKSSHDWVRLALGCKRTWNSRNI